MRTYDGLSAPGRELRIYADTKAGALAKARRDGSAVATCRELPLADEPVTIQDGAGQPSVRLRACEPGSTPDDDRSQSHHTHTKKVARPKGGGRKP